jgi:predicted protein tyrosine phosphatase
LFGNFFTDRFESGNRFKWLNNYFNSWQMRRNPKSDRKISENDLIWAELIFVMETEQRSKLKALYPHLEMPPIEVLNIPDDYEFMNDDLVEILTIGINGALKANYNI